MSGDINQSEQFRYCGQGLDDFHSNYRRWHGYLSFLICILGIIANSLNIIVLTRKEMRSPTNAILTGLAVADLAVMIDYVPYTCHEFIFAEINSREEQFTYSWAWFVKFHSIFGQICHTISIWLTVTLAIWRYIAIDYPQKNRIWCGMQTTVTTIATSYIVCPLIVAPPFYLAFSIAPVTEVLDINGNKLRTSTETDIRTKNKVPSTNVSRLGSNDDGRNVTLYKMVVSQLANSHPLLLNLNFIIYSVLIKLIPCVALTVLSIRLIAALLEVKRRQILLSTSSDNRRKEYSKNAIEKEKQTNRTTKMLLAVLLLFLITELPQGILGLLSAIHGEEFFHQCYLKLGDFMDLLALVNSGINFILYCSMSRQFRSTFSLLFRPKILDQWIPLGGRERDICGHSRGVDNNCLTTQVTSL